MVWRFILLFAGVFACSTSAIFIKASHVHPIVLTALRLTIAVVLLAPVYLRERRRHREAMQGINLARTLPPAAVLAAHLISWSIGARMTAVAQSTLIVNLVPVAMPFFLFWFVKERIARTEVIGTAVAVLGLVLLTSHDSGSGTGSLPGNLVCVGSMLLFALYLALGRRNRDFPSIWLYVIPIYAQAAIICLVVSLPWIGSFPVASAKEWSLMLGLAVFPTVIGHSILNASMRHIRGQIVSLCNVSQFVFAGIMAVILFRELPPAIYYFSSALVVSGVVLVVLATPPDSLPEEEPT